ncbi:MAG: SMP-30/gluconolactonase/LRE family protein [Elainellaceae cyanobacterium]
MSDTVIGYNPRIYDLVSPDAVLEQLAGGAKHSEGPIYLPQEDSVVWSDVSGNRLFRWSAADGVSVIREPSQYQNGNALDSEGRIVACSHGQRAIIRREQRSDEASGEWRVLCGGYHGKRLNSPNDLVVKSDGSIWFTDPPFGLTQPEEGCGGEQEQAGSFVFRFDPSAGAVGAGEASAAGSASPEIDPSQGAITPVVAEMERPNGLAFSPDERILYVSDTSQVDYPQGHHTIRAYDIVDSPMGQVEAANSRVFAVIGPGQPDGLTVDRHGNVFTSSADSVQVYAPDGTRLGKILVPEVCTNVTFGGLDGKRLFITAGTSLYAITVL